MALCSKKARDAGLFLLPVRTAELGPRFPASSPNGTRPNIVIPAKAGIQERLRANALVSRLRGNDEILECVLPKRHWVKPAMTEYSRPPAPPA